VTAPVIVDRRGHMLLLVLNRPDARNAATVEMATLVGDALHAADADRSIRVVVITGGGGAVFLRGRRLGWGCRRQASAASRSPRVELPGVGATASQGPTDRRSQRLRARRRIRGRPRLRHRGRLHRCNIRHAGGEAGPPGGGRRPVRLPAAVASKIAVYAMLTGEPMDAVTARGWGLVNEVVAADAVLPRAMAIAEIIAAPGPLAVRATKAVGRIISDGSFAAEELGWQVIDAELPAVKNSADAIEGPRAFLVKRPSRWSGR
jgi:crotonobetainyl-CoA hydratase